MTTQGTRQLIYLHWVIRNAGFDFSGDADPPPRREAMRKRDLVDWRQRVVALDTGPTKANPYDIYRTIALDTIALTPAPPQHLYHGCRRHGWKLSNTTFVRRGRNLTSRLLKASFRLKTSIMADTCPLDTTIKSARPRSNREGS